MPFARHLRRGLIASVLLGAAFSSAALTLGRSRGVALIGRTLDLTIAVTLDNPGQADDLCQQAEVFQGDMRVDPSRVTVTVEPAGTLEALVRVRSNQAVDEPVVTVYLRLGCNQRLTRRYVLLSEQPGEFVPPVAAALPTVPAAAAPAAAGPAPGSQGAATAAAAGTTSSRTTTAPRSRARAPVTRSSRSTDAAPEMSPRGAAASRAERSLAQVPQQRRGGAGPRSRLTVDLLDLQPERDPQLRFSNGMIAAPTANEQVRAQAAALWRSINAQPEDVLRDLQRVQALEADVKNLRTLVSGNDKTLADLREQLNQTQQERTLTMAIIALLTLLLAAAVVTWWLRRGERSGSGEWWRRGDAVAPVPAAGAEPARPPKSTTAPLARPVDLRVDESMYESLKKQQPPPRATQAPVASGPRASPAPGEGPSSLFQSFQASQHGSMRMVKAEELVDIQQQADFFMSLGQSEQAIDVLENHIQNNAETSALVWLDLLAIYRSLKRRDDYELLRADFQRVFNAEVPSYDTTPTVSGGLEDYPRALSRIAALWPSPKVMDVIEESIFRKPGMAEGKPFDLEAYRELVMLYNLGREVVQPVSVPGEDWTLSDSQTSTFFQTAMQPLSAALDTRPPDDQPSSDVPIDVDSMLLEDEMPVTRIDEFPDPQMPRPSPRLGLDIDLSGPAKLTRSGPDTRIDFELSGPGENLPADDKPEKK